jgi:large subunit ribosomal protein L25
MGTLREEKGKGGAKKLRAEGKIPAVCYQNEEEALSLVFDAHEFTLLLAKRPTLINVAWGKGEENSRECIIREIQRHPVSQVPIHIDLLGITRGVLMDTSVRIELVGTPDGVRNEGGILQQTMAEVAIRCLPRNIPQVIEVDVTRLNIGESIHLAEVEVEDIEWNDNPERTVAAVVAPRIATADEEGEGEEGEEGEEGAEDGADEAEGDEE